jgi:hypothetical protein
MKKINILVGIFLILGLTIIYPSTKEVVIHTTPVDSIVDEKLFINELNESILEFAKDMGVSPDSIYQIK